MTKWIRKDDLGSVVEIIDYDPTGLFHPDIKWEKVSEDKAVLTTDNGLTPEDNPLAIAARELHQQIIDEIKAATAEAAGELPKE